jgi:hypothetical protein
VGSFWNLDSLHLLLLQLFLLLMAAFITYDHTGNHCSRLHVWTHTYSSATAQQSTHRSQWTIAWLTQLLDSDCTRSGRNSPLKGLTHVATSCDACSATEYHDANCTVWRGITDYVAVAVGCATRLWYHAAGGEPGNGGSCNMLSSALTASLMNVFFFSILGRIKVSIFSNNSSFVRK